jgi:hypothetical protein
MTLRSTLVFYVTRKDINMNMKEFTSALIIYHCSTSLGSILGIIIYIFTIGMEYIDNLYA